MAEIRSTRLRFFSSKTPEALVAAVDSLQFKVEIKGGPAHDGKRWVLFFVLPEMEGIDLKSGDVGG